MNRTLVMGQRVLQQLVHDRRFFVISIVGPLIIIYFLKIFMDTLPPTVPIGRYIMPFAAFIIMFLSFLLCAIVLVQERTSGTMERVFVSGYRRAELIGGYVLGYLGLITLQAVVVTLTVLLLFDLGYDAGTVGLLLVVNWQLATVSVLLGIFVSTFTQHERHVFPFIPLIILPAFFLSGMLVAVEQLPGWAQILGWLSPLRYANDAIQEIILPDGDTGVMLLNIAILLFYGLILLVIASRTLKDTV
ncbi:MAG TPA: ABC transporter permease [candidate division Zixibacteria bacterium]|nr:ABC transporter permease [candidate division Zixibacteria bacterium]